MNRDKQIDEIYEDLVEIFDEEYNKRNLITPQNTAEKLVDKGYRKSTDLAREIFEEIERAFFKHYDEQVTYSSPTLPYHSREAVGFSLNVLFMGIEKLKKKYIGEDTNVLTKESEGEG